MKATWSKSRQSGYTNGAITSSCVTIFRLLRVPNLFILIATIVLITKRIVHPPLIEHGIAPLMTNKEYYLFLFIVACLGAGGYLHNDMRDYETDIINEKRGFIKPGISNKIAYLTYIFLTIGPLLPLYALSMEVDKPLWIIFYLVIAFLLWTYNVRFKQVAVIGNIIVAGLCGFAILIPYFIESQAMIQLGLLNSLAVEEIHRTTWSFACFGFSANLIREIVKDVEDLEGDKQIGYKTLPILMGVPVTKRIIVFLSVLFTIMVGSWMIVSFSLHSPWGYLLIFSLLIPAILLSYLAIKTESVNDYRRLSFGWKINFLLGIFSLFVISLS